MTVPADDAEQRTLLSGGEMRQTYLDRARGILWKYADTGRDTTTVDVTVPGTPEVMFTFVENRARSSDFEQTILTIMDNLHVHRGENAGEEAAGLSVDAVSFDREGFWRRYRYLLLVCVAIALAALFRVDRLLTNRRQNTIEQGIDAAVRERKRRASPTKRRLNAAESYIRDSLSGACKRRDGRRP